jgi:hypothetical protein
MTHSVFGVHVFQAVSENPELANYCVSHFFTSYPMPGNVLGLAWIGKPELDEGGGICAPGKHWLAWPGLAMDEGGGICAPGKHWLAWPVLAMDEGGGICAPGEHWLAWQWTRVGAFAPQVSTGWPGLDWQWTRVGAFAPQVSTGWLAALSQFLLQTR